MSEMRDRLERLATRGARRGPDAVIEAASDPANLESAAGGTDPSIADDDLPFVTPEPERRGRFGALVAAVGVAALVGVGALAAASIFGSGGAGSPEAAVRQLADAVSHKDPLAAVDVLVPTEVRSMRDTVKAATQRAADLRIVNDASQPLAGVDLSVDNLQLSTETLADGYAKVTITSGVISASTHEAAMSNLLQAAIGTGGAGSAQASVDLAHLASNENLPTFVIVVRRDGGWYVSPAYTALEYAREVADGPAADFGSADAASLGADTPESAVSDALHAWQSGDWDRLIALAPPDELPVYDYRAWIDQAAAAANTHPDFTIDKLSTTSAITGDTAVVKLTASGTNGSGDNVETWQVGGTCPSAGFGYSSSSASGSFEPNGDDTSTTSKSPVSGLCLAGDLGEELPFGLIDVGSDEGAAATGPVSIETVLEDGRWFVSPVSTALDVVDSTIQHLDQRSVDSLLGIAYQLPPDATITLDQPFSPPTDSDVTHVYAFEGTAGQRVVGAASGVGSDFFESGEVYTTSGHDVGYVEFDDVNGGSFGGPPLTLPTTGSYRLVVDGGTAKGVTLTLFDAKDAPKSLLAPKVGNSTNGGIETCTRSLNSESCTSSSSAETPATVPVPLPSTETPTMACTGSKTVSCNFAQVSSPLPSVPATSAP